MEEELVAIALHVDRIVDIAAVDVGGRRRTRHVLFFADLHFGVEVARGFGAAVVDDALDSASQGIVTIGCHFACAGVCMPRHAVLIVIDELSLTDGCVILHDEIAVGVVLPHVE